MIFSLVVILLLSSADAQFDDAQWMGIVGGESRQEFVPFVVSMLYNDSDHSGDLGLMGGGIAINEHYVLTAGHLFDDFPEE